MMNRSRTEAMRLSKRSTSRARVYLAVALAALLLSWSFPRRVQAADGDLDTGFGIGGMFMVDAGYDEAILAVALQPDGKVIGAGTLGTKKRGFDFALGLLLSDGTPDVEFGDAG